MLSDWRKKNEVTRAQLAQRVGTSEVSIWRIENDQQTPSLRLAAKLEEETGIPAKDFLGANGQPAQ